MNQGYELTIQWKGPTTGKALKPRMALVKWCNEYKGLGDRQVFINILDWLSNWGLMSKSVLLRSCRDVVFYQTRDKCRAHALLWPLSISPSLSFLQLHHKGTRQPTYFSKPEWVDIENTMFMAFDIKSGNETRKCILKNRKACLSHSTFSGQAW